MTPVDRLYTRTHEWVKVDGATATIGITDYAQHALGDITYIDAPKVGTVLTPGQECGVIESVKAASDLYAPVGGTVRAINPALADTPELVNRAPYGDGWLFILDIPAGAPPPPDLLAAAAYDAEVANHA